MLDKLKKHPLYFAIAISFFTITITVGVMVFIYNIIIDSIQNKYEQKIDFLNDKLNSIDRGLSDSNRFLDLRTLFYSDSNKISNTSSKYYHNGYFYALNETSYWNHTISNIKDLIEEITEVKYEYDIAEKYKLHLWRSKNEYYLEKQNVENFLYKKLFSYISIDIQNISEYLTLLGEFLSEYYEEENISLDSSKYFGIFKDGDIVAFMLFSDLYNKYLFIDDSDEISFSIQNMQKI